MGRLKSAGLFLAAPFIALAYIVLLPVYGISQLISVAYEAYEYKKNIPTPATD
jgi:hypothetical protein